jgi:hypothetical protein
MAFVALLKVNGPREDLPIRGFWNFVPEVVPLLSQDAGIEARVGDPCFPQVALDLALIDFFLKTGKRKALYPRVPCRQTYPAAVRVIPASALLAAQAGPVAAPAPWTGR